MTERRRLLRGMILCFLLCGNVASLAEQRTLTLPNGLVAVADYRIGESDRPAVLVLHGFLQTHYFSTIRLITDYLHIHGYTVLAPNLTLGVNRRTAPLACDAIHHHNIEQGNVELNHWLEWLREQGHRHVILAGHSTGSSQLLSFLSHYPSSNVIAFFPLGIGPIKGTHNYRNFTLQVERAREMIAASDKQLGRFSIGFCRNNYRAPAKDFLSYLDWSEERMLKALRSLSLPVTAVLGMDDNWLPPDWAQRLRKQGTGLRIIEGANHYFSGNAETAFQQTLLELIKQAHWQEGL